MKDRLAHTLHLHNLNDPKFPYALQTRLLMGMGWDGWALLEVSDPVDDRVLALIEQRQIWQRLVDDAVPPWRRPPSRTASAQLL